MAPQTTELSPTGPLSKAYPHTKTRHAAQSVHPEDGGIFFPIKRSNPQRRMKTKQLVVNGDKYQHIWPQLIGKAILRSPGRRLTLAQIYQSISDDKVIAIGASQKNTIRNCLCGRPYFIKIERQRGDSGRHGDFWGIARGEEILWAPDYSRSIVAEQEATLPPSAALSTFRQAASPSISISTQLPPAFINLTSYDIGGEELSAISQLSASPLHSPRPEIVSLSHTEQPMVGSLAALVSGGQKQGEAIFTNDSGYSSTGSTATSSFQNASPILEADALYGPGRAEVEIERIRKLSSYHTDVNSLATSPLLVDDRTVPLPPSPSAARLRNPLTQPTSSSSSSPNATLPARRTTPSPVQATENNYIPWSPPSRTPDLQEDFPPLGGPLFP